MTNDEPEYSTPRERLESTLTEPPSSVTAAKPNRTHAATYSSPSGSYLGRAEYISSIVPIDEEDARKYRAGREDAPSETYQKFLRDLRAFDIPPRSVRDSLITNFDERCRPWMPVVDSISIDCEDGSETSMLLLQAIFVAGSKVSTAPHAQSSGEEFYRRAKALYYSDYEKDPLVIIQAICLLQWWNPSGPEHVSMDASTFWLHMGVALAHQIGLHRDPSPGQHNAGFRRRLWWTLVARDCVISASHGRPRAIHKKDFDVRPLTVEDFPLDDRSDARLFMTYVEICSILGDLTEHITRGTLGRSSRTTIEHRLFRWMSELPREFHIHDRRTGQLCPYNFKARQLHIPYFFSLSILFRPTVMDTPPSVAPVLSSSFVVGIYDEFLARGEIPFLGPVFIFYLLAAALAEVACHNYPLLWAKTEKEFDVINRALDEFAQRFPSALGAQRVVKGVTAAIQKQQSQRPSFELAVSEEQFQFFDFFGPDLCSKWDLVYGFRANSQRKSLAPRELQQRDATRLPNDMNDKDMNADDFAVAGLISLQDPKSASTPLPVSQSLPGAFPPFTAADDLRTLSMEPQGLHFSTSSLIDPVGNWMLNDWMTDLTYWDSIPKDQ
ncbi:hypothetical protein FQN53_003441 [Emmonsiellopsis sp. PD_33]|nr:hypothetical protein FQN53_003441 [Emmonsiellopsis sp. PD_33]